MRESFYSQYYQASKCLGAQSAEWRLENTPTASLNRGKTLPMSALYTTQNDLMV